jgi:hypothetical protein
MVRMTPPSARTAEPLMAMAWGAGDESDNGGNFFRSLEFEAGSRSPEVSSTAFDAQPLDLHSVP